MRQQQRLNSQQLPRPRIDVHVVYAHAHTYTTLRDLRLLASKLSLYYVCISKIPSTTLTLQKPRQNSQLSMYGGNFSYCMLRRLFPTFYCTMKLHICSCYSIDAIISQFYVKYIGRDAVKNDTANLCWLLAGILAPLYCKRNLFGFNVIYYLFS